MRYKKGDRVVDLLFGRRWTIMGIDGKWYRLYLKTTAGDFTSYREEGEIILDFKIYLDAI